MSKRDELVAEIRDFDRSKENLKEYRRALLGRGTIDERSAKVQGREGYFWVRNRQDPNQVYAALGGNHPDIPGWPVIVGPHQVDNPVLRIIDSDWVQLTNLYNFSGTSSSIGAHHWQHEDYAWDMVNVGKFMIKPFRTFPALNGHPFDVIIEYDEAAYLGPKLINFELIDGYETTPLKGVRVSLFTGSTVSADQYVMICLNDACDDFELIYGDAATESSPSLSPGGYPTGAPPAAATPATKPSLIDALANNLYPVSRVSLRRYAIRLKQSDVQPLTPLFTWPGKYWATGVWMDGRGWFTGSSTVEEALIELAMRTFSGSGGSDWKVKVSADDTTPGYVEQKITADDPLSVYTQNGGGNETFHIVHTNPFEVRVSSDDSTTGFLEQKIVGDDDYINVYVQHDLGDDHEVLVIAYSGPTIEPSLDTQQRTTVKRWYTGDGTTTTFRLGAFALVGSTQVNLNSSPQNLNFDYYESEMGSCIKFNTAPTGSSKIHVQFLQAHGGDDVNLFINPTCATGTSSDGWVLQSGIYGNQPHLSGGSINSTVTSGAAVIPIMKQTLYLRSGNYELVRSYFDRWDNGDRIEIWNSGSTVQRWAYDPPIYGLNVWGREEFPLVLPRDDWYTFQFYDRNTNSGRYSNMRLARISSLHPSEDTFSTDSIVDNGCFYDTATGWTLTGGFSRVEELNRVKLYVGGVLKSTNTSANTATQTIHLLAGKYYTISFYYYNAFGGSADVRILNGGTPLWTTGELNTLSNTTDHLLHYTYYNASEGDYTFQLRSNNNSGVYFGGIRAYKTS